VTRAAVLRDANIPAGIGQFAVIQALAPSLGLEVSAINELDAEGKEYTAGLDPSVATSRSGWQKPSRSASRRGSERKRGPSRKRDRVATRRWF
jgi:hypothetical protein